MTLLDPESSAFVSVAEPQSVVTSTASPVVWEPMASGDEIPMLIRPASGAVDLVAWARENRDLVAGRLLEHGALLFRGFKVMTPEHLHDFVGATSTGPLLEYKDRSTPRYEVGAGVYVSTIYPADQRIHPHNEGTYWRTWPLKLYFCCLRAAVRGGETPIADVRKVYDRIDPTVRAIFREKQVMYVRNYNPGIGLTWQDAFQTQDKAVVEQYAAQNRIETEWTGTHLRTRQIRPAIRIHPATGKPIWFNHAAFFHVTSLDPEVRDALLSSYAESGLPYHTYFGDGSPIDPDMVAHIRDAYNAEKRMFAWQNGDVLLLDNMAVAHAREPYSGDRHVIVAMTEAQSDATS